MGGSQKFLRKIIFGRICFGNFFLDKVFQGKQFWTNQPSPTQFSMNLRAQSLELVSHQTQSFHSTPVNPASSEPGQFNSLCKSKRQSKNHSKSRNSCFLFYNAELQNFP